MSGSVFRGRGGWALLAVAGLAAVLAGCAATNAGGPGSSVAAPGESIAAALDAARDSARRGAHGEVVEVLVRALGDSAGRWPPATEYQARRSLGASYLWLGQQRRALAEFQRSLDLALQMQDGALAAEARGQLGNAQLSLGDVAAARGVLEEALAQARGAGNEQVLAAVLNNRGNALAAGGDGAGAAAAYRESAGLAAAENPLLAASALTNGARLALDGNAPDAAQQSLDEARRVAGRAGDSQAKAHVLVTIGSTYRRLAEAAPKRAAEELEAARATLDQAVRVAESLPDPRTLSYAWGELGAVYRRAGQGEEALRLTRRALLEAQRADAPESLYRWELQLARLLWRAGEQEGALAAYGRAVDAVQRTRQESASCYSEAGSNFRGVAAPLYEEWVDRLLRRAAAAEGAEGLVRQAREALEVLQVFELQDYFEDDCVAAAAYRQVSVDEVSSDTAILYLVSLPERLELLVSLPSGMRSFAVPVGMTELAAEALAFRRTLENRTTWGFLPHARRLFDWVVRPVEPLLAAEGVGTLVFVPSGPLRGVPLAALHDGRQFLVERFATGVIPGLNLTDPQPLDPQRSKVLSLGLTEPVQGFPGLPHVAGEFQAIRDVFEETALLNQRFQVAAARDALADPSYGIVHIASHGQFGETRDDTFLLAYDGRITLDDLGSSANRLRYRERPLELLTLSACETAAGDDRAALGLAGVAVKAGARSAVATLWTVNDVAASTLVAAFYRGLAGGGMSRAAALRDAQRQVLADPLYDHPAYWAPFILINNWL